MYYRKKLIKNLAVYIELYRNHSLFSFVIFPTISIDMNSSPVKYFTIDFIFGYKKISITFLRLKEK